MALYISEIKEKKPNTNTEIIMFILKLQIKEILIFVKHILIFREKPKLVISFFLRY